MEFPVALKDGTFCKFPSSVSTPHKHEFILPKPNKDGTFTMYPSDSLEWRLFTTVIAPRLWGDRGSVAKDCRGKGQGIAIIDRRGTFEKRARAGAHVSRALQAIRDGHFSYTSRPPQAIRFGVGGPVSTSSGQSTLEPQRSKSRASSHDDVVSSSS